MPLHIPAQGEKYHLGQQPTLSVVKDDYLLTLESTVFVPRGPGPYQSIFAAVGLVSDECH